MTVSNEQQEKEVKLWGGRFEESVTPAVEKFGQSVSYDKKLYKFDLQGSRAHATMLAKQVDIVPFQLPCPHPFFTIYPMLITSIHKLNILDFHH